MGIYDRDYYREKKEKRSLSQTIFKLSWYLIAFLLAAAFVVYLLAIFSEK
jgi:hypothetical protein